MQHMYQPKETDVSRPTSRLCGFVWDARRRARLHFAALNDRALADVGLTGDQRWRERMEALPSVQQFRASQPPRGPIEHARKWPDGHRPKY